MKTFYKVTYYLSEPHNTRETVHYEYFSSYKKVRDFLKEDYDEIIPKKYKPLFCSDFKNRKRTTTNLIYNLWSVTKECLQ